MPFLALLTFCISGNFIFFPPLKVISPAARFFGPEVAIEHPNRETGWGEAVLIAETLDTPALENAA